MQKLTKEEIQFIDNYLKNSDIIFTDIRCEMVDHVASEIEAIMNEDNLKSFYHVFKDYMAKNKATLMKNNKFFYKSCDKKIFRSIIKSIFSVKGILIFISVFLCFIFLNKILSQHLFVEVMKLLPFAVFIIFIGIYSFVWKNKKHRFSSIERIGIYFMVIGQLINLELQGLLFRKAIVSEQNIVLILITSFLIFMLIILAQLVFKFKKEYQSRYINLV